MVKSYTNNDGNYNDTINRAQKLGNQATKLFSGYSSGKYGFGSNFGSGTPWGAIGSAAKSGYNLISNKDPEDYSDLEQTVIYPLQGASTGASFGPWGALGGALYGLGYSFKDDLGLKNSNFLTQMLFPISMGDNGGLKVNGKSLLDLG